MANTKFDSKSFNPEAFKYMVGRVPNLHMHEIKKSRALAGNPDIRDVFSSQNGTGYARIAMRGLLDGDAVNYDGQTDITATSTKTFEQGVVVTGRAKAWVEKDFSYDITGGVDFMQNIADQVAEYADGLDQNTILAVCEGIFSMTGTKNQEFVSKHTYDVTAKVEGKMSATTLNSATNQACGANKKKFTLVFMHSDVATNLENLNLVSHLKYTDAEGIQRDLELYTWNGKLVVVDDDMPNAEKTGCYVKAKSTDEGALEVVEYYYQRKFDRESLDFNRFIVHLRFFAQRLFQAAPGCAEEYDNEFQEMIRRSCAPHYKCAQHIAEYIRNAYQKEVSDAELIYLTIHLKRINLANS